MTEKGATLASKLICMYIDTLEVVVFQSLIKLRTSLLACTHCNSQHGDVNRKFGVKSQIAIFDLRLAKTYLRLCFKDLKLTSII